MQDHCSAVLNAAGIEALFPSSPSPFGMGRLGGYNKAEGRLADWAGAQLLRSYASPDFPLGKAFMLAESAFEKPSLPRSKCLSLDAKQEGVIRGEKSMVTTAESPATAKAVHAVHQA